MFSRSIILLSRTLMITFCLLTLSSSFNIYFCIFVWLLLSGAQWNPFKGLGGQLSFTILNFRADVSLCVCHWSVETWLRLSLDFARNFPSSFSISCYNCQLRVWRTITHLKNVHISTIYWRKNVFVDLFRYIHIPSSIHESKKGLFRY